MEFATFENLSGAVPVVLIKDDKGKFLRVFTIKLDDLTRAIANLPKGKSLEISDTDEDHMLRPFAKWKIEVVDKNET